VKVIAVAAPSRVRTRLAAASGPVTFLHRGPLAVHLDVDGWCVGVVGTAAAAVPCALRLATPGVGDLAAAASAHVVDGVLHLDGVPLVVGRTLAVTVPRLSDTWQPFDASLVDRAGLSEVRRELPGPALDLLSAGDAGVVAGAVHALVGRGSGLTPTGDDVLCGWLAIHHAVGVGVPDVERAVSASVSRTTTLSATLLDCALHGEVLAEFARLVRALGSSVDLEAAVEGLARIGHTSGRALLLGADLALSSLAPGLAPGQMELRQTERGRCA
jgi:hypothetical protein